ncbi:MAG: DUF429 domain-containing protein [Actinobacteria bacterium]|nr:DUF429 domain-containing protein [Actinomycetota bacterium]
MTGAVQGDGPDLVAGVDGCRGGWVVVTVGCTPQDRVRPSVVVCATFAEVARRRFRAIAVDMPIGLPTAGARAADVATRAVLGPRRSSVFPAPVRGVLDAVEYAEASARHRSIDGRGLTRQAWNLLPKIREVDAVVRAEGDDRIREAHPEAAFAALAGAPLVDPKRSASGAARRRALLRAALPELASTLDAGPPAGAAADDLADAAVLAWSARRLVTGTAVTVGDGAPDAMGLRMRICW